MERRSIRATLCPTRMCPHTRGAIWLGSSLRPIPHPHAYPHAHQVGAGMRVPAGTTDGRSGDGIRNDEHHAMATGRHAMTSVASSLPSADILAVEKPDIA